MESVAPQSSRFFEHVLGLDDLRASAKLISVSSAMLLSLLALLLLLDDLTQV
jgi:hypothetical protein